MLWIVAALMGLAYTFFKLGSMSVWVGLLMGGIKLAILIIVLLTVALVWQKIEVSRNNFKTLRRTSL